MRQEAAVNQHLNARDAVGRLYMTEIPAIHDHVRVVVLLTGQSGPFSTIPGHTWAFEPDVQNANVRTFGNVKKQISDFGRSPRCKGAECGRGHHQGRHEVIKSQYARETADQRLLAAAQAWPVREVHFKRPAIILGSIFRALPPIRGSWLLPHCRFAIHRW
ncbi:hypothetical protein IMX07_08240 [bacterium]|nr:hypothetical protein [bacterium]